MNSSFKSNKSSRLDNSSSTSSTDALAICGVRPDEFKILTGVPLVTHEKVMNVGGLSASDLHLLKKKDPFMYYSIPGSTNPDMTDQGLDRMLPSLVLGNPGSSESERSRTVSRRRSMSDSHLLVKRRSRISYESHFDVMLEGIMGEMGELQAQAKRRRSSYENKESQVERTQAGQPRVEHTEPRRGSILQDILFSVFDSVQEDENEEAPE